MHLFEFVCIIWSDACLCNLSSASPIPPASYTWINKTGFLSKKNFFFGILCGWGCQRSDHSLQSSWTKILLPPVTWISASLWPSFQLVPSSAFCKEVMHRNRPLACRRQLNSFERSDSEPGPCYPLCWITVTFTIHVYALINHSNKIFITPS